MSQRFPPRVSSRQHHHAFLSSRTAGKADTASDFVTKRNVMLDQLLSDFNGPPPPVPAKDERSTRTGRLRADASRRDVRPSRLLAPAYESRITRERELALRRASATDAPAQDSQTVERVIIVGGPGEQFTKDDSGILTPPPPSTYMPTFEEEMGRFKLCLEPSIYDPPPAPRFSRFDVELQEAPKRKPPPLKLTARTSQTDKWTVRTLEVPGAEADAPDTAGMLAATKDNSRPKTPPRSERRKLMQARPEFSPPKVVYEEPDSAELASEAEVTPFSEDEEFSKQEARMSGETVIEDGPDMPAELSMAASKGRAIFPLPYMPLKSKPLRSDARPAHRAPAHQKAPSLDTTRWATISMSMYPGHHQPSIQIHDSPSPPEHSPVTPSTQFSENPQLATSPGASDTVSRAEEQPQVSISRSKTTLIPRQHPSILRPGPRKERPTNSVPVGKKDVRNTMEREAEEICQSYLKDNAPNEDTLRWLGLIPERESKVHTHRTAQSTRVVGTDRSRILGSYFHRPTGSI